jgi:hypothetical protein
MKLAHVRRRSRLEPRHRLAEHERAAHADTVGGAAHQPGHQQAGQQAAVFDRHRSAMGETRTQQIDKQNFLIHGIFTIGPDRTVY